MAYHGQVERLMQALRCLPGVGPKSAQRMTFHLLERDRQGGKFLAESLMSAIEKVGHCSQCRTLTELNTCSICANAARDRSLLCVVETPADVLAIDQATVFGGVFYVLHGRLSPLDGIGPDELGLDMLDRRIAAGEVKELILATNTTVEGEATSHYISDMARHYDVHTTRIAHGVPVGGELEYIDSGTLAHAFSGRRQI